MAIFIPSSPPESASSSRQRFALWNLGFRAFYLFAGLFAALAIAFWVAQLGGGLGSHIYLANPLWHAHEMIFGYVFAVIVGFLFTAVRNWTNRPTPTGKALAAIVALWLTGRVLILAPSPLFAERPIPRSRSRRRWAWACRLSRAGATAIIF